MHNRSSEAQCNQASKRLDFALPIDTSGTKTVTITTDQFDQANPLRCGAFGITASGGGIGGAMKNSVVGVQATTLPAVSIPGNGALGAFCDVPYRAGIISVRWNQ
jgi:hypothetical protein